MKDVFKKISELMENHSREEFNEAFFPTQLSSEEFKILVKKIIENIELVNKYPSTRKKFNIMKQFFEKLRDDKLYEVGLESLYEDQYLHTKKMDQGLSVFDGFEKKWNSKKEIIPIKDLCTAYAYQFERFCQRYLKPVAQKFKYGIS